MLKINKKVEYGLIAIKYIAQQENSQNLVSTRDICNRFQIPFDTTAKVMQIMNNDGILNSQKGIKGGYTLAKPLSEISFLYFAVLIEGDGHLLNCHKNGIPCTKIDSCNIASPIESLNVQINNFLDTLTLDNLFNYNNILKVDHE